jgi:hypothetical protein
MPVPFGRGTDRTGASAFAIIDGHPDPDRARFVHAHADAYAEGAEAAGHSVDFLLLRTKLDWYRHLVSGRARCCSVGESSRPAAAIAFFLI